MDAETSRRVFQKGDKVRYSPESFDGGSENGIVKSVAENGTVFVVYKCADNWDDYENYTGQGTDPDDLRHGWV